MNAVKHSIEFVVDGWAAWSPAYERRSLWQTWAGAGLESGANITAGPDELPQLPLALRRRISPIGQKMLAVALAADPTNKAERYVFASRHGEMSRTMSILDAVLKTELPSPADFSLAVHNALAGLLSIHTGQQGGHTAIAAGADSFAYGLLEAIATLAVNPDRAVLVCYGDGKLPGSYSGLAGAENDLPMASAFCIRAATPSDPGLSMTMGPTKPWQSVTASQATDFLRFFLSGASNVECAGPRMTWSWRRVAKT